MRSNFKIEGLDCANCAMELERTLGKIEGVRQVNINFMTERMEIEYDGDSKEEIIKKIKKVITKGEPDVRIEEM